MTISLRYIVDNIRKKYFVHGKIVECLPENGYRNFLKSGIRYTIKDVATNTGTIHLNEINNQWWTMSRFKLIND